MDAKRREYNVIVVGEEEHFAYNRVGLTSFFQHRDVESLYLNPKEWVRRSREFFGLLQTTWLMGCWPSMPVCPKGL